MPIKSAPFTIEDRALWPPHCPNCAYSWQGLTVPRCPECGEQVADGELVIVGISIKHRGALTGEDWKKESIPFIVGFAILPIILLATGKLIDGVVIFSLFFTASLLTTMFLLTVRHRRRSGSPVGVIRLSPEGFRIGAGNTVGWLRSWSRYPRVELTQFPHSLRLGVYRMSRRVALWKAIEVEFQCDGSFHPGLRERLEAWTSHPIRFRNRAS